MKIEKIVAQLNEKDYALLCEQFRQTKADKYLMLINFYRGNPPADKEIQESLDIKPAAFYTLKSRLFDKIQEFLYKSTSDHRIELLQNVANIEYLLFKTPRETAVGIIQKLEAELIRNDMPNELIAVYKALKKLHVYSPKYYDYQQLYNKQVAYFLAQDKAEEVLSFYCKTLCEFYVTRDQKLIDILVLYRREIQNLSNIHQSHRLTIYKNILNIHFALFTPIPLEMKDDPTVEDLLKESYAILETNTEDRSYIHLIFAIHFLSFEYYHQLKLYKNAMMYYDKIVDENVSILLYDHSCFSIHFLISKLELNLQNNTINEVDEEAAPVLELTPENITEYIVFIHYKAAVLFYKEKYSEAGQLLNNLINEVSFKNMLHAEIETKLFLTLLLLLAEKTDQAEIVLRSLTRKMAEENDESKFQIAQQYVKLLKLAIANKTPGKPEKLKEAYQLLTAINTGTYATLPYVRISDAHLKKISR
jgi:hypothetical protein